MRPDRIAAIFLLLSLCATPAFAAEDASLQFFENRIRPLLAEKCYQCHSTTAKKLRANLYLDSREGMLKGGDNGALLVPGHPERSKLIEAIGWSDVDLQMPPKEKLSDEQIADLSTWVKMGAPFPASDGAKPLAAVKVFDLEKRKASHWCWEPIRRQSPPAVKDAAWAQSPIDRFVLAKIEAQGLAPAPRADRPTLIRRAYFDVIGLPPTSDEVQAFVADGAPDAFAKVVDHLLASDHFGERWARHWMDLVRYAETRGHEFEPLIPNAWQYRDYLIRAYNADVPYNQFVTEHLAGDLLSHPRLNPANGYNESILGTGFWFLGEEVHSPVDIRQDEADRMNNRVDTMTKAFIGMTVGCARCHDHKFDAISQKDFYGLYGFLLSSCYRQVPFGSMEHNRPIAEKLAALRSKTAAELLPALLASERPALGHLADYLLASRDILLAGREESTEADELAQRRNLDPAILHEWVKELAIARKRSAHPLHAFALAGDGSAIASSASPAPDASEEGKTSRLRNRSADALQPLLARWRHESVAAAQQPAPEQTILDFDSAAPGAPWYADGVAFGLGPVRAGELLLGDGQTGITLGVASWSAARRDPVFPAFERAPGTETDYGALGTFNRSGQSIRTRTVVLKTGNLWYLIRGSGGAFAEVDSHTIIGGPLHGRLLEHFKASKDGGWRWVHHDLTEYAGERCHVEFNPAGAGDFEVAKVIEADRPPLLDQENSVVLGAISDPQIDSAQSLARAYQKIFSSVADRLAAGDFSDSSERHDRAALADFLVRRSALFTPGAALPPAVAEIETRFGAAQSELAAQIQTQSPTAPAMWDGNGVDENILVRGVAKNPGAIAPRHMLEAIGGAHQAPYPADGSGRLRFAQEMLADNNPFTSRVMVNRVWHHLFGRGIVPTVDNFGVLGQPPTHRELLDYLADHFRTDQGWSVKKLIRSIMLSSVYQLSSKAPPASEQIDPQNLTFSHANIRRLEGEAIRDEMLAVSGRLDPQVGGPSVEVYLTPFMDGRGKPGRSGPLDGDGRRSIYTRVRRNFLSPMMLAFDMPQPMACVGRRNISNVPAQALILMNDPFVADQAEIWAKKVLAPANRSAGQRIADLYAAALARAPRPEETRDALEFLDQQGEAYGLAPADRLTDVRPWKDLCHVMFNLKEFIFIE